MENGAGLDGGQPCLRRDDCVVFVDDLVCSVPYEVPEPVDVFEALVD